MGLILQLAFKDRHSFIVDVAEKIEKSSLGLRLFMFNYAAISWDFKCTLHFYKSTGQQGRLIQINSFKVVEDVVAPEWDENLILVEDNDGPHGRESFGFVASRQYICMLLQDAMTR